MTHADPCDTESANVTQLMPSRSSLWLNWRIARYGVTEQAREHGRAMVSWIFQFHPDEIVRQTAFGMLKVLQRRGTWNQSGPRN